VPETAGTLVAAPESSRRRLPVARIAAGVVALGAVVAIGRLAGGYVDAFARWVEGFGVWGPVVFIVGYAVAVVAFVPASLLTIAAGSIFGLAKGALYVFVAAVLGSVAAFLIARYLARGAIERRLAGNARFAAIDRAIGAEGRKIVFLLRLSPVFPFTLLNYALGLTRVRFADYLVASVGMIPGTFLYVYGGRLFRGVNVGAVIGIVATVLVTALVTRIARRALREATGE
jgi:uncharacterized membrane protein YdjX (TVP38/TMEM64 family)